MIAQEVSKQTRLEPVDLGDITDRVRARVAQMHGLALHRLVLVRSGQIPKTSSGKVRRGECSRLYLESELKLFADGSAYNVQAAEPVTSDHGAPTQGKRCLK